MEDAGKGRMDAVPSKDWGGTVERRRFLGTVPEKSRGAFERAFGGKSRTAAVKAKCLECTGYDRKAVRACNIPTCPLWDYRPFKGGEEEET